MNCLFLSNRGSGQVFMQTTIIKQLCKTYDKVVVAAINKELIIPLLEEYENLEIIGHEGLTSMFNIIFQDKDNWKVITSHPYEKDSFKMRNDNFFDCFREICGLERTNKWNENGAPDEDVPVVNCPENIVKAANDFCSQHNNFVIVQLVAGGINPIGKREFQPENGLLRRYSMKNAEKLVDLLNKEGYEVLNYGLKEEPRIKGTTILSNEAPQLLYHELAKRPECKGIITIDSSLLHLSSINNNVVCIWKQTDCSAFGYQKCKNVSARKDKPLVPLMTGFPDAPICDEPTPEEIIELFKK